MNRTRAASAALLVAAVSAAGCSTVRTPLKADPLEGVNRSIFTFNDAVDKAVLKPVAQGYVKVVPQFVRNGVSNFFSNIGDVYTAANNYLQGNIQAGTQDVMRVTINTLFGVGGLIDVATQARLPRHQQDFGLTLGHYGVPAGPYLVLPLLGPSTARDTVGYVVDRFADPTTYINPATMRNVLYGIRLVNARAALLSAGDLLSDAALDKYSFVRNAYLQRRNYLIREGRGGAAEGAEEGGGALPSYDEVGPTDTGPTPEAAGTGVAVPPAAPGGAGVEKPAAGQPASAPPGQAVEGAQPAPAASGAQAPAAASGPPGESNVPGGQVIPPGNYFPSLRLR